MSAAGLLREKRIPEQPGVYLMKDGAGGIIYIGKARNLHKRVASYFVRKRPGAEWKTERLVSRIKDIDFVVTDNEIEAFLLESNLIKRYRPVFNIELKDQQRYTYLKVTNEPFPRLLVARRNRAGEFIGPKGRVYGPFVRGSSKYLTVGLLRKLFKIRICNRLPNKPCLQYFIKNCDAPCIQMVSQERYMAGVTSLQEILEGRRSVDAFVEEMQKEMRHASDIGDYERAKEIRDTLHRLGNLRVRQKMERADSKAPDEEYVGILKDASKGVAHVMSLRRTRGVICDRKTFDFELVGDNSLSTFLLQYYSSVPSIPRYVFVNERLEERDLLEKSLERIAGHRVSIATLTEKKSGQKSEMMALIRRNLELYMEKGHDPAVVELKNAIGLGVMPHIMDCFDVSNLGSDIAVGASCRFVDGRPDKSSYRKFRIKFVKGQNDFAMIGELVRRRYSSADRLPDLVVVDGGIGQLRAAHASLRSIGINDLTCIGLAKENEEVYVQGALQPIRLPKSNAGLKLLQRIRDEAHRFGLAYNINLRRSD
ncbi:MAG TPA: excinuclease ABC subunit UvrC [Nitrososphaera sp.]|nr:excinuclease ABC subunit UvrC [Nitrososphaera sp.]